MDQTPKKKSRSGAQSSTAYRANKAYRAPKLSRYGDMRKITAGTKGGVKGDGPDSPSAPKTRVVS
jgi:hypothetical protein